MLFILLSQLNMAYPDYKIHSFQVEGLNMWRKNKGMLPFIS